MTGNPIHFSDMISKGYRFIGNLCFWSILCLLICFSVFSTCYIAADSSEITFFVKDHWYANVCVVPVVFLVLFICRKIPLISDRWIRLDADETYFKKIRRNLLLVIFVVAGVWVLATQYVAKSDQVMVQYGAYMLHYKDYQLFAKAGYLERCQNQLGLVWISYLLSFVFGNYNYVGFQLLNVAALTAAYWELAEICAGFGMKRSRQIVTILLGILFFPMIMYCSFVYGTILGFMPALAAIRHGHIFLRTGKRRDAISAILLMTLAVWIKMNYLIFMLGLLTTALFDAITKRRLKRCLFPIIMVVFCMAQSYGTALVTECVTGQPQEGGASAWSFVAMGLQDSAGSAGWWNGYNEYSYIESGYDAAVQAERAKADIAESLRRFGEDKKAALQFFGKKTASQWNNPTFQCFWINQTSQAGVEESGWVWWLTSPEGAYAFTHYLNLLQFLVLAGAIGYACGNHKKQQLPEKLTLVIIFVGGFIFHLFWEAKAQYTITYFVLLFPYTVMGYERMCEGGRHCLEQVKASEIGRDLTGRWTEWGSLFLTAAIVAAFGLVCNAGKAAWLTADTERYAEYLLEVKESPVLADGTYQFFTSAEDVLGWTDEGDENAAENGAAILCRSGSGKEVSLSVNSYRGTSRLYLPQQNVYLTALTDSGSGDMVLAGIPSANTSEQLWMIRDAGDGGVFFLTNTTLALAYDEKEKTVFLTEFTGAPEQIWYVR